MERHAADEAGEAPDPFEQLAQMLDEAGDRLREAGAPGPVLDALRSTGQAVRHAADLLAARSGADRPDVLSEWRHGVRGLGTAVTGWAQVFLLAPDETRRARAGEAVERNATALRQLLAAPPHERP